MRVERTINLMVTPPLKPGGMRERFFRRSRTAEAGGMRERFFHRSPRLKLKTTG